MKSVFIISLLLFYFPVSSFSAKKSKLPRAPDSYYAIVDISGDIDKHLSAMVQLCSSDQSFEEKVFTVKQSIKGLRELAAQYLPKSHKLSTKHHRMLLGIKEILNPINFTEGREITKETVKTINIRDSFVSYYRAVHNLGENTKPEQFASQWARKTAKGLSCLYQ